MCVYVRYPYRHFIALSSGELGNNNNLRSTPSTQMLVSMYHLQPKRRGREGRPLGKIADSRIGTRKVERETRICASNNDGDMRKGTGATLKNILLAKSWKFELQNK